MQELTNKDFKVESVGKASYLSYSFGDGLELAIEPLIGGNYYVALYNKNALLIEPKQATGYGLEGALEALLLANELYKKYK